VGVCMGCVGVSVLLGVEFVWVCEGFISVVCMFVVCLVCCVCMWVWCVRVCVVCVCVVMCVYVSVWCMSVCKFVFSWLCVRCVCMCLWRVRWVCTCVCVCCLYVSLLRVFCGSLIGCVRMFGMGVGV